MLTWEPERDYEVTIRAASNDEFTYDSRNSEPFHFRMKKTAGMKLAGEQRPSSPLPPSKKEPEKELEKEPEKEPLDVPKVRLVRGEKQKSLVWSEVRGAEKYVVERKSRKTGKTVTREFKGNRVNFTNSENGYFCTVTAIPEDTSRYLPSTSAIIYIPGVKKKDSKVKDKGDSDTKESKTPQKTKTPSKPKVKLTPEEKVIHSLLEPPLTMGDGRKCALLEITWYSKVKSGAKAGENGYFWLNVKNKPEKNTFHGVIFNPDSYRKSTTVVMRVAEGEVTVEEQQVSLQLDLTGRRDIGFYDENNETERRFIANENSIGISFACQDGKWEGISSDGNYTFKMTKVTQEEANQKLEEIKATQKKTRKTNHKLSY
ncbi:MAG: hypothetical protein Q4C70_08725 [Planctomycetia bacterium]|nr:hypothetical protein [Planctomycetia bacterium]